MRRTVSAAYMRQYNAKRDEARARALEACQAIGTIAPAIPWHMGILVGLEKDGLLARLPDRDRLDDERFELTPAGKAQVGA